MGENPGIFYLEGKTIKKKIAAALICAGLTAFLPLAQNSVTPPVGLGADGKRGGRRFVY